MNNDRKTQNLRKKEKENPEELEEIETEQTSPIEAEQLYLENTDGIITEPFNPKDVDIVSQPMVISNIVEDLKDGSIILDPDFQRIPDLWNPQINCCRRFTTIICNKKIYGTERR